MHSSSLILFAVVLIIALHTLPISGKNVKSVSPATTTLAPTTNLAAKLKQPEKTPVAKPAAKDAKKKPAKKRYESFALQFISRKNYILIS